VVQLEELIYNLSEVTEKNHGNPGIIRTGFGVELAPGPAEYNERGMGGGGGLLTFLPRFLQGAFPVTIYVLFVEENVRKFVFNNHDCKI